MKYMVAPIMLALALNLVGAAASYAEPNISGSPERAEINTSVIDFKAGHRDGTTTAAAAKPKKCDNILCRPLRCMDEPDGTTYCFGQPAGPAPVARAKLTPGSVLEAARKVGLPALRINIQPGNATLVNLDTIFYARPQPFNRSVTLLGYDIDLAATPVLYAWHHGDGTSHTTSRPGAPYPSKDVTYRYQRAAERVSPSVDVTYRVRYRVDGGPWQTLAQTLTATGPAGNLQVKEAGAVLTRG